MSTGSPSPTKLPSWLFLAGSLIFGFNAASNGDGLGMVASWFFLGGALMTIVGGRRS